MFVELHTIELLVPELILVVMAAWIFLVGHSRTWWASFALATYAVATFALLRHGWSLWDVLSAGAGGSSGPLSVDLLAYGFRLVALVAGAILTLISLQGEDDLSGEYLGSLMLATAGVMLASFANELIYLFLALELVSIPTYVLLFLGRRDRASAEATTKYFFLSILSSGLLLYGFSFLYGLTGTTTLDGIRLALEVNTDTAVARGGLEGLSSMMLVLIFAGLGFRITAVPFHFYAPDVYQGTTNVNAGLLAVLPKLVGFVALIRILVVALPTSMQFAWQLCIVLAILTMTLGNVCALWQTNLRRLLAYSSIAHSGYILMGLAVGLAAADSEVGYGGIAALVLYVVVYAFASLSAFAVLSYFSTRRRECSTVNDLAGVGRTAPLPAAAMAVAMFSLAGIPPLAGFWGKLTLLTSALGLASSTGNAALSGWFIVLAVIGVVNAAIAAAYYLRVIGVMYFTPAEISQPIEGRWGAGIAAAVCTALVVGLGLVPGPLVQSAEQMERTVRRSRIIPVTERAVIGWNETGREHASGPAR